MLIPYQQIEEHTLITLIEAVVLRDGTDYGDTELSLSEKVQMVLEQLKSGDAVIEYSEAHDSVNIIGSR